MTMKYLCIVVILITSTVTLVAQHFDMNADLRMRYEMRNGYGTLKPDNFSAANFVAQRSRLVLNYSNNNMSLRISPQNVRVWGDVTTLSKGDDFMSLHEVYGEAKISKTFALKLGRQELNYDDARIFGNVDWAIQGRSHDALLLKTRIDSNSVVHLGIAYNALGESNFKLDYRLAQYKALQFLWYQGKYDDLSISVLALNNGVEYGPVGDVKISYSQTLGGYLTYKLGDLKFNLSSYLQSGKIGDNKVNGLYHQLTLDYKINPSFSASLGYEFLSGKAGNDKTTDIRSFNPLFGTNHKFNGFMDYFYVGNHINSIGLIDYNANLAYTPGKFYAKLAPHLFYAAADNYNGLAKLSNSLGTEIDLTLGYKVYNDFSVEGGYAQMFATESMEYLKGGNKDNTNSWIYLAVKFNPILFKFKSENN